MRWEIPETLAGLLRAARADALELEADPTYCVDFGAIIDTTRTGKRAPCEIDLAGALLIRRFGAASDGEVNVDALPREQQKMVGCLDALGQGLTGRAAALLRDAIKAQRKAVYPHLERAYACHSPRFDHSNNPALREAAIDSALAVLDEAGI